MSDSADSAFPDRGGDREGADFWGIPIFRQGGTQGVSGVADSASSDRETLGSSKDKLSFREGEFSPIWD